ncbi:MAG: Coenzyme F420 hydrogenase/dehydrogenase, beta subunit C-terminal domain [Curvibacter sp.]|jgi:coenzyme F420 hydrogenase subunit beta|nr:Coenzyme F420 hydrogenase/dehydrogenase, beta subunit C-terminal domain [Curvibacter sp.]
MSLNAPHRRLCTDCGLSRTAQPQRCGQACQFIRPDYPGLERRVQGRARGEGPSAGEDELFFGPYQQMLSARLRPPLAGAQWTGITTRIAERLLEQGQVDAVIAMAPHPQDRWRPMPVLVTRPEDMARCRGMRMGYAPLLELVEPALAQGYKRLAVIGIPCQVYALRAIQPQLEQEQGLQSLWVIGTPCSDNTTTENFHEFLGLLSDRPQDIGYLEFRADYKVEIRTDQGEHRLIPFLNLPLSRLRPDFFPLTCRTCVDYTNVLADITVGYMGGQGQQWLLVRNARGRALLDALGDEVLACIPRSSGRREGAVRGFMANTERAAGGLPLRRMPGWLRPLVNWLMPRIGPRGLEFARARVEMKAIETVLHLRREAPARMKSMVPDHVWALVQRYGIKAETRTDSGRV